MSDVADVAAETTEAATAVVTEVVSSGHPVLIGVTIGVAVTAAVGAGVYYSIKRLRAWKNSSSSEESDSTT